MVVYLGFGRRLRDFCLVVCCWLRVAWFADDLRCGLMFNGVVLHCSLVYEA